MNHPFDIGIIEKVFKAKDSEKVMIQVRVMMRPENIGKSEIVIGELVIGSPEFRKLITLEYYTYTATVWPEPI